MHPALLCGLIVIPLLLIVAIIMALGSEGEQPVRNDVPVADGPPVIAPPPVVHNPQPDGPKPVPRPSKAQMDALEAGWAPLRTKFKVMLRLRNEGKVFWQQQDHENAQDKWHAAKDVFNEIRDTAQELLTDGFTEEQYERYLDAYDTELAEWSREFATFSKYLTVRDD
jgi:hypothetical protein